MPTVTSVMSLEATSGHVQHYTNGGASVTSSSQPHPAFNAAEFRNDFSVPNTFAAQANYNPAIFSSQANYLAQCSGFFGADAFPGFIPKSTAQLNAHAQIASHFSESVAASMEKNHLAMSPHSRLTNPDASKEHSLFQGTSSHVSNESFANASHNLGAYPPSSGSMYSPGHRSSGGGSQSQSSPFRTGRPPHINYSPIQQGRHTSSSSNSRNTSFNSSPGNNSFGSGQHASFSPSGDRVPFPLDKPAPHQALENFPEDSSRKTESRSPKHDLSSEEEFQRNFFEALRRSGRLDERNPQLPTSILSPHDMLLCGGKIVPPSPAAAQLPGSQVSPGNPPSSQMSLPPVISGSRPSVPEASPSMSIAIPSTQSTSMPSIGNTKISDNPIRMLDESNESNQDIKSEPKPESDTTPSLEFKLAGNPNQMPEHELDIKPNLDSEPEFHLTEKPESEPPAVCKVESGSEHEPQPDQNVLERESRENVEETPSHEPAGPKPGFQAENPVSSSSPPPEMEHTVTPKLEPSLNDSKGGYDSSEMNPERSSSDHLSSLDTSLSDKMSGPESGSDRTDRPLDSSREQDGQYYQQDSSPDPRPPSGYRSPSGSRSPNPDMMYPWNQDNLPPGRLEHQAAIMHAINSQGEKTEIFFCHLCSYTGNSKFHFNSHMNSHFEHRCPHCDYTSRTEGRLKRHIKDFHSEVPPENFSGNRTMRNSPATTPGRPKVYRCKQCEFVATTKVEFWVHAKMHIKEDKILQCPKCPFVTEYKHHLEYHLRNHFGSKPFKCTKCNYSCVNKSMLNSHMKSHTNVYQYRCADCTYATKYCHSLKLHLRKYNHKPATVLNLDGSLPIDETNSGDLLTPRRGPPRGPRGPRKDKDNASPNIMPLPQSQMNGPRLSLNGALLPSMYWPVLNQMTNGLHPPLPPPLIPVTNIGTLDLGHMSKPIDVLKPELISPFRCNLCEFTGENREGLNNHMIKVHAAENQDLFSAFGISSESLVDEQMGKLPGDTGKKLTQGTPGLSLIHESEMQGKGSSPQPWSHSGAMNPDESMSGDSQNIPEGYYKMPPSTSHNSRPLSRESNSSTPKIRENGEIPLDLTKRRDSLEMGGGAMETNMPKQKTNAPFSRKRRILEGQVSTSPVIDEYQQGSPNPSLSPTPRKRSRKGKAYKLDTICMKLQETCPESAGEYESDDYSAGQQDNARPNSGTPQENERASDQEGEGEVNSNIDYNEIHDSLSKLNNEANSGCERYGFIGGNGMKPVKPSPYHRLNMLANSIEASLQRQHHPEEYGQDEAGSETLPNGEQLSDSSTSNQGMEDLQNHGKVKGHAITMKGNNYECQYCDIAFGDCVMYTMHMGYHGFQDPFHCNNCGYQAKDKVEFFLHIARVAHT